MADRHRDRLFILCLPPIAYPERMWRERWIEFYREVNRRLPKYSNWVEFRLWWILRLAVVFTFPPPKSEPEPETKSEPKPEPKPKQNS